MIGEIIHVIKIRQAELSLSLAMGNASSWESYQRMSGEYQGLQRALDFIDQKLKEEDQE